MSLHELVQAFQDEDIESIDQYFHVNKIKQEDCKQNGKRSTN